MATSALTIEIGQPEKQLATTRLLGVALVAVHLVIGAVLLADPGMRAGPFVHHSDASHFYAIATHRGMPYRDFAVEYPPGLVLAAMALALGNFSSFLDALTVIALACDLSIAWVVWRRWGGDAGVTYLVLSAPLLPLELTRFDLLAALLAVLALAVATRPGRQTTAGVLLAAAAFVKLWPVALVALWIASSGWRAVRSFVVTGVACALAWVAVGGTGGISQVLTFRGARGWQVESLPGTLLVLLGDGPVRYEKGAFRVGDPPAAIGLLLAFLAVTAIAAIAVRRRRRPAGADAGAPALALVATVLTTATLCSPQFMIWLVPWAAVAAAGGDRRSARLVLAAVLLTVAAQAGWGAEHAAATGAQLFYWLRNLMLVATVLSATAGMARRGPEAARLRPSLEVHPDV